MRVAKVKCPYCNAIFEYSEEEVEWVPVLKWITISEEPTSEKYVAKCKNKNCEKKIEFWMKAR